MSSPKRFLLLLILSAAVLALPFSAFGQPPPQESLYLPVVLNSYCPPDSLDRINAPYFGSDSIPFSQTAIAWFGKVTPHQNYADIRVGYNNSQLYVYLAVFDRSLWYDENPPPEQLTEWDAVTLLLDTGGNNTLSSSSWRFTAQLSGDSSPAHRAVYRGGAGGWQPASIIFQAEPGWRGNALNDDSDTDRGWAMGFTIPFSSLGVSAPPAAGSRWRMAVILHDRDSQNGAPLPEQSWPPPASLNNLACWGWLNFGLPVYDAGVSPSGSITIRRPNEKSPLVPDADMGGTSTNQCPGNDDHIWKEWGSKNYGNAPDFNIQNQSDVADWPCFAKYYVTFPLDEIPRGKVIVSATLTLHQFGNSGDTGQAKPSWIQVLTAAADWQESTITWNNAPLAYENFGGSWVQPLSQMPDWPGVARQWNVSAAAAKAYAQGQPLRLILYSADSDYHSGKYFVSSDTGDWNIEGRPKLEVIWGDP